MPTVVVIPVKSFRTGKRRLSDAIDDHRRAGLATALAGHVASTVVAADLIPLIVTADADVAEWATAEGFPSLPDPGDGLDTAATTGVEWAATSGSRWIVLHGDLPLLTVDEMRHLGSLSAARRSLIAPSSDGGTSAIGSHRPIDFAFGAASFHRHLRRLDSPQVVIRSGLLLDVDSPADLAAATSSPLGAWLEEVLI